MSIVHVVPLGDLIEHDVPDGIPDYAIAKAGADSWLAIECPPDRIGRLCVCMPHAEMVRTVDDRPGWVVTHHSLDGRELSE